jgi:hypothetical protein
MSNVQDAHSSMEQRLSSPSESTNSLRLRDILGNSF